MPIIQAVREYILTFPLINELSNVIGVEYLSEDTGTFSIEEVPNDTILNTYLDGSSERVFTFILAARFFYSDETINNINNSGFFENFREWLENNTENGVFPQLDSNMKPSSIEATTNGYLFNIASGMREARYQIQCRMTYDYNRKEI